MCRIKKLIKASAFGKWVLKKRRIKWCRRYIRLNEKQFCQYSSTKLSNTDEAYLRLRIILTSHTIEKGLSHKTIKAGFGKETIVELSTMVNQYIHFKNRDEFALANAISVLNEYHNSNFELGFDDSSYLSIPILTDTLSYGRAGSKAYSLTETNNVGIFSFEQYSSNRTSVRLFDFPGERISRDEFLECIHIAQNAPSACNRQSARIHVVMNKSKFSEIERLQLGCRGFAQNASAFIFITNDLSLYENGEFKLPIFEAGVFTLNLVYALQEKNIYSCILNASFPNDVDYEIYRIAEIPVNESINGLIVVYKISSGITINIPSSLRRKPEEISNFIE